MFKLPEYQQWEEEQKRSGISELERAARWWDLLADAEVDKLVWDKTAEKADIEFRANMYLHAAQALRIQERTGVAVCSCCFKPISSGECRCGQPRRK